MEFLFLTFEALLGMIDLIALSIDVYSWFKGRKNRIDRRAARKTGLPIPPRDRWNRRVIILTIVVALLTAALLIWTLLKMG